MGCWLALSASVAGATDLDELLASLTRKPPQTIAFVETHRSPLLVRELVVSGVLEYRGMDALSRIVTEPYRERTDIDGGEVRIRREGRPERRFSLRQGKELGGMLIAFSSLLAGDRRALEAAFEVSAMFDAGGWQLDLVPRQADQTGRAVKIRVTGAGTAPGCIVVMAADGGATTTIGLGDSASGATAGCAEPNRGP